MDGFVLGLVVPFLISVMVDSFRRYALSYWLIQRLSLRRWVEMEGVQEGDVSCIYRTEWVRSLDDFSFKTYTMASSLSE